MISLRSIVLAVLSIAFLICVIDARIVDQYGLSTFTEDHMAVPYVAGDYRLRAFDDFNFPHKRVPSAGDMMVRFGKRSV
ncbi:hypothetical protein NECAME_08917 [Necator americanus]|uniref:Uncharacterized protein n=1 Tax=Necator americanus TaxID=51031 RepID=W2TG51_NECAM|nr:hypothetical protein NECAME_08917 [Necator americanus]ETN80783.1 hypothetical protein NECAME_08917 [Necator americanus]